MDPIPASQYWWTPHMPNPPALGLEVDKIC